MVKHLIYKGFTLMQTGNAAVNESKRVKKPVAEKEEYEKQYS